MPWDLNSGVVQLPTFSTSINSYTPADYNNAAGPELHRRLSQRQPRPAGRRADEPVREDRVRLAVRLRLAGVARPQGGHRRRGAWTSDWPSSCPTSSSTTRTRPRSAGSSRSIAGTPPPGRPRVSTMGNRLRRACGEDSRRRLDGQLAAVRQHRHSARADARRPEDQPELPAAGLQRPARGRPPEVVPRDLPDAQGDPVPPDGSYLPTATPSRPRSSRRISQYVVNIIDFRDPDCTMTQFVNTDLVDAPTRPRTRSPPRRPTSRRPPPPVSRHHASRPASADYAVLAPPNTTPLSSGAWNTTRSRSTRSWPTSTSARTRPAANDTTTPTALHRAGQHADPGLQHLRHRRPRIPLGLPGWGFVITQDDPAAPRTRRLQRRRAAERHHRPAPPDAPSTTTSSPLYTRSDRPPPARPAARSSRPLDPRATTDRPTTSSATASAGPAPTVQPATSRAYGYLTVERHTPTLDGVQLDALVNQIPADRPEAARTWPPGRSTTPIAAITTGSTCSGRPTPRTSTSKKVVVDSFRFPYFIDNGTVKKVGHEQRRR